MESMFRDKPIYNYCGLTIVLDHPSRFDVKSAHPRHTLLNSGAGFLIEELLKPDYNRYQCDIRLIDEKEPLLEGTKCLLVCGSNAATKFIGSNENTLGEIRGSVFKTETGIPFTCSFYPQDAVDPKDFESQFAGEDSFDDSEEDNHESQDDENSKEDAIGVKRRHGKTKRRNFRFWLQQDINKCKHIIKYGIPQPAWQPIYHTNLSSSDIINLFRSNKGRKLFIDLETWIPTPDIKCLGFAFDNDPNVYIFPWFDYNLSWSYTNLPEIIRALAYCINNNTIVAHNGKCFDFSVLTWKYRIPLNRKMEDTLIMFHRMFPEVERSLGHMISCLTWLKFHKDMGNVGYNNRQQQQQTLEYCGVDVHSMQVCYYEMIHRAEKIPGMIESFRTANAAIYPYLLSEMMGIHYKEEIRQEKLKENDRWMMQYLRMCEILVGKDNLQKIRGKGKSSLLASPQQCVTYFHDILGYPVVGRGKMTVKGTRNPSLGAKNMFKLRLKHPDNPVIDLVMAYRGVAKESGALKFQKWDLNNTKIEDSDDNNNDTKYIAEQYNLPI